MLEIIVTYPRQRGFLKLLLLCNLYLSNGDVLVLKKDENLIFKTLAALLLFGILSIHSILSVNEI